MDNPPAPKPARQTISFVLNGQPVTAAAEPDRTLLDVLREDFGLISPKSGCQPQGACGCCTVLIDGQPKLSCNRKVAQAAGHQITTLEGLSAELRAQVADCFVRAGGVQCGFCTPGIVMRTVALLDRDPDPSRAEIARALRPHLCRCTGYKKIIDAVALLARARRGEAPPRPDPGEGVGARLARYRGRDLVLGEFRFVDDLRSAGMLYAGLRFSDHPRALVKSIDAAAARALPGVHRVITAADVPGERYVGLITRDWPILVALGEETRCVGDVLAIVVAADQGTARAAARRIGIEYEVLPPLTSPADALQPGAPQIHPAGNLLSRSTIRRGDVDAALRESAHVVTETYATQRVEHMFLEPEACIAIPQVQERIPAKLGARRDSRTSGIPQVQEGIPAKLGARRDSRTSGRRDSRTSGRRDSRTSGQAVASLKVLSQGQGVFDDRRQIAAVLGWDVQRVLVELVSNGGAFGGKEDLSIQAQTALAAVLTAQPVKCTLTREESFRLHPKRHPIQIDIQVGCGAAGHLTAVRARLVGDKGAYASVGAKVLERAAGHAVGPYRVPHVDIESLAVYTNNPPGGAMRGFGVSQAAFAMERSLDRLARAVGIDGWEIRWRNALELGDSFCTGQTLDKPFGLKRCLLAVKDAYRGARYAGIACGVKNVGLGNGMPDEGKAVLRVEAADRVAIYTAFTEMGQGHHTICTQIACQETGLPAAVFAPRTDTSVDVNCGQTTASRATVLGGLAVVQAARRLRAALEGGRPLGDLVGQEFRGHYACTYTTPLGADVPHPKTHLTYGFAAQVVILTDDGKLKQVVAAHDVGKALNPTLLEGQIEGAIHMGLGYALSEEFVVAGGHIQTADVSSLQVLRAHHMPEIEVILIEEPDPETPYGARGVGEIGLVPTAPAVAGALEAFDGIHRTRLPMKDSPAARAILKPPRKATV